MNDKAPFEAVIRSTPYPGAHWRRDELACGHAVAWDTRVSKPAKRRRCEVCRQISNDHAEMLDATT